MIDQETCWIEILDVSDQEEYPGIREKWVMDGEGFVLLYSVGSRSSFTRTRKFYNKIGVKKLHWSTFLAPHTEPFPIMLVGNNFERTREREVSTEEGNALAREFGCEFLEASAENCINVEKKFYDVVRMIRKQRIRAATQ